MITYKRIWDDSPYEVPVLHKVYYNSKYTYGEMRYWCKENCRAPVYFGLGLPSLVEFEDDVEATAFALKFS